MGKRLQFLLKEKPRSARMKGLPKLHKEGVPISPITSGVGSVPQQRLAKCLAKPRQPCWGASAVHTSRILPTFSTG